MKIHIRITYVNIYRVFDNNPPIRNVQVERVKSNKKILHHFVIFIIIIEKIIKKDLLTS